MKRALLFSYFFPPANESASRRIRCFVKYLPEFGWIPSIVCREWNEGNCDFDRNLLDGIDPSHILASVSGDPGTGKRAFASERSHRVQKVLSPKKYPTQWTKNVMDRMDSICDSGPFDLVIGSCGPTSTLYLAGTAAKRLRLPWVADFRDLAGQSGIPPRWKDALVTMRLRQAECRMARSATFCTTTTAGQASLIRQRIGVPVEVVRNGFDPAEFSNLEPKEASEKFELIHAGSLHLDRSPQPFLDAIANLIAKDAIRKEEVKLSFYGVAEGDPFPASLLPEFGHPEIVSTIGKVNSTQCRRALRQASLLMLPGEPEQVTVGAKLYEYIASGTPTIVGPPPHEAAREILANSGAGFIAESESDLESILRRCYLEWRETGMVSRETNEEKVLQYSRREQTRRFAQHLDKLCEE